MRSFPNVLLIAGTGRNVGKSTVMEKLIQRHEAYNLMAIKVSPHFHNANPSGLPFIIEEEKDPERSKDSSRFLKAGAANVYFIQVKDDFILEAFRKVYLYAGKERPVIVESGGLANFIDPGLLLFVEGENTDTKNVNILEKADLILNMYTSDFYLGNILFERGEWKLR